MTETRKQIIELIEPYMDKSLSDGCIVFWDKRYWKSEWRKTDTSEYWNWEKLLHFNFETWSWFVCNHIPKSMKILWHYDITAVLKYIDDITWNWFSILWDEIIISANLKNEYFPVKPLHLYTEQEEKELLDLLNKLK